MLPAPGYIRGTHIYSLISQKGPEEFPCLSLDGPYEDTCQWMLMGRPFNELLSGTEKMKCRASEEVLKVSWRLPFIS